MVKEKVLKTIYCWFCGIGFKYIQLKPIFTNQFGLKVKIGYACKECREKHREK